METKYHCPRCRRELETYKCMDGAVIILGCRTAECRARFKARTTRVGCWGTQWQHPEEIEAVQRTHDRICGCRAARVAREVSR